MSDDTFPPLFSVREEGLETSPREKESRKSVSLDVVSIQRLNANRAITVIRYLIESVARESLKPARFSATR